VLDHALSGDRQAAGEDRRARLARINEDVEQLPARGVGQRGEHRLDALARVASHR